MRTKFAVLFLMVYCTVFSQKPDLQPFVKFLQDKKLPTAKDYILNRFTTHDIVVISERDHRDITQYDLYIDILKDPSFKGNIYTEVGCKNNYQKINTFLLSTALTPQQKEEELLAIYRDLDYTVVWENYNYYYLISSIYDINKTRADKDKILLFPLDVEFNWDTYTCHEQYAQFDNYIENSLIDRNIIMGQNFVEFYEYAKHRNPQHAKALVIQNTYHGYIRIPEFLPLPTQPDIYSTAQYIYKTYPQTTTNVYVNYYTQAFHNGLTNNGLFDAAFAYTKTDNVGFDLNNTPFGNAPFDLYKFGGDYQAATFSHIFDGMVFYKPVADINIVRGIPNIYPKALWKQFYERIALIDGITYEEAVKEYSRMLAAINEKKETRLPEAQLNRIKQQIAYWIE